MECAGPPALFDWAFTVIPSLPRDRHAPSLIKARRFLRSASLRCGAVFVARAKRIGRGFPLMPMRGIWPRRRCVPEGE